MVSLERLRCSMGCTAKLTHWGYFAGLSDPGYWNWISAGWQLGLPQRHDTAEGWEPFVL
jgi:hypothetical protein